MAEVAHRSSWAAAAPPEALRLRLSRLLLPALDLLLVAYAAALTLILLTGGFDLGVLRLHEPAKPVFVLLILIPLRVAVGGRSWVADPIQRAAAGAATTVAGAWARMPAAVADTLFAVVTVRAATLSAAFLANIVFEPALPRGFTLPFANEKFVEIFVAWDLYVLVSLLVPLSSNTLEGLGRYASVLFPAFMLAGSMTTQRAHEGIVIVSLVFRTLLICFFVTWHPIY